MNRIEQLYSDLARLGRETDMMDTVIRMLADDLMEATTADGNSRHVVLSRVVDGGFELAALLGERLNLPSPPSDGAADPDEDLRVSFRHSHVAFTGAASHLTALAPDTVIDYRGLQLTPGDVVPQRIAEIVLAHDALGTAWTIEEADPDSALDALEALMRRARRAEGVPALVLETEEGDRWELGQNGQRVFGDRETLVQWLAWGEPGELESEDALPAMPTLPHWS